jgi:hypothetical protein
MNRRYAGRSYLDRTGDDEARQFAPNGNPTAEYLARLRMKDRQDEQRTVTATRAAKRDAETGKVAKCGKGATAPGCEP